MPEDYFSKQASDYAKHRPHYPEALFEFLASVSPGRDRAWDCATGNGQAAVALSKYFKEIVATDLSEKQIGEARADGKIRYRVAMAEHSGIEAGSVDLTTVAQAFHWLDFDDFFQEVRRVSRPRAVLAVWGYGLQSVAPEIDPLLKKYYSEIVGPYWPVEVKWVREKYRTIPFPFEGIPAPKFSMEQEWTLDQMIGYFVSWSSTQRYREAKKTDPIPAIRDELALVWGPSEQKRAVKWELYLRVGRV